MRNLGEKSKNPTYLSTNCLNGTKEIIYSHLDDFRRNITPYVNYTIEQLPN
jgi:hypothetical protein